MWLRGGVYKFVRVCLIACVRARVSVCVCVCVSECMCVYVKISAGG